MKATKQNGVKKKANSVRLTTLVRQLLNERSRELEKTYKEIDGAQFTRLAVVGAQIAEVDYIKRLIKEKVA